MTFKNPVFTESELEHEPHADPTPAMIAALQDFANRNGRYWKQELSDKWANGRDTLEPNAGGLRSVRNQLGPTWLYDVCRIRPEPKPRRR